MNRNAAIDLIKAVAIVLVVLFHLNKASLGYLGVDVFFVIAGFLTWKSTCKACEGSGYSALGFLLKRVVRLLPLVVVSSLVSLSIGYFAMLPFDFKSLAESAIASCFFSNNILQWITTRDYWAVTNGYKPLMHFWYLGVLFEMYVLFAIVFSRARDSKSLARRTWIVAVVSVASLAAYLLQLGGQGVCFYFLPSRFWEFGLGACLASYMRNRGFHPGRGFKVIGTLTLASAFLVGVFVDSPRIVLVSTCLFTAWILALSDSLRPLSVNSRIASAVLWVGGASFSIYVWHQILIAFIRYSCGEDWPVCVAISFVVGMLLIGWLSYRFVEQSRFVVSRCGVVICLIVFALVNVWSYRLHRCQGIVRDVPELDLFAGKSNVGKHSNYNMHIFSCDLPFPENGKKNVLVVGDSFARDWCNVMFESSLSNRVNISYCSQKDRPEDWNSRLASADIVFYTTGGLESDPLSFIPDLFPAGRLGIEKSKVFVVGTKYFGVCNGQFYVRRNDPGYLGSVVPIPEEVVEANVNSRNRFGSHYIDLLGFLSDGHGSMPVFTDSGKYISQDCKHFTRSGAIYAAKRVDIEEVVTKRIELAKEQL